MEEYDNFTQPVEAMSELVEEVPVEEPPKEVRIEVIYNWTEDRIKEEIRNTFPETPGVAVAVFTCESGLRMVRSVGYVWYGREESYGIAQIHSRDWQTTAEKIGLGDYQSNPMSNIKMARYIYDNGPGWSSWSCFTKNMYQQYL